MFFKKIEVKGELPSERAAHSMIAIGQSFWVFGGNCNFQFFNDLYKFTLKTNTWEKITYNNLKTDIQNIPIPRAGHTMEYYENFLVVF